MKKYSILLSAAFGILALASCQVEVGLEEVTTPQNPIVNGCIPFVLNANIAETKTTLDPSDYSLAWDDNDVLYAVTTDSEWGSGTSSSDASGDEIATFEYEEGRFTTTKEISVGEHTFNFIYEGSGQKKYHRAAGSTHQLYATQSADATNPAANLKANDALVGQITHTVPSSFADVSLHHLYSLMKVTINNKLGDAVTVNKFQIQIEGEDIAGIFNVAFNTPGVSIKSSGTDVITVNITNGEIANNGSIDVYFVMAPVADFTGDVTFTVTDNNDNTYSKTNSVTDLSFAAGSYNTASYTLRPDPTKTYSRITSLEDLETGDYMIVGEQTSTSFGYLTYGTLSSSRIPYTKTYSSYASLPDDIDSNDGNSAWHLTVSGSSPKTVTIYNAKQDKYLSNTISYVAAGSATSFTATVTDDLFAFAYSGNYLGVNKSSNYWKVYASSTLTQTNGLALYKYEEPSTLVSIAIDPSSTHPTEFYQNDAFSFEGLVVKATYDNSKVKTVTPTSVSTPDMSAIASGVEVTVTYTEGGVTKTATYSVDILARPVFNVTLGDTSEPTVVLSEESSGAGVVLPVRDDPAGYTFEGWSLTNIASATESTPTIIPAGTYHPTGNVTVYPVYSYEETETRWNKITDLSTITAGTYALITENDYAFNGELSGKYIGQKTDTAFTFVENVATSAPSGTCEITLTTSGDGFTMYNATKGYLYASGAAKENLKWHAEEDCYWYNNSGKWTYSKDYNGSKGILRTFSSDNTFRVYGSATNQNLYFAKKVTTSITYYISNPS